ncbi:MAG: serine/threonine-protein kinase [Polyangiales bacterium]
MFSPGDVLGNKYRLDRLLGEGGMGAVFAAENLNTGRRVAVKVLHAALMTHPEAGARFIREARATTSIAHPNIVEVLDLDTDAARKVVYIVQEFLEGETLEARLEREAGHRLPPEEVVALALPAMEALVAAHARGIVHRDLKPGNLFLQRRPGGELIPKVIDFGIAKDVAQASPSSQTREGTMIGTPAYMSPEQVAGRADVDAQTDVWAMGAVLFECLSGRLPYEAETFNLLVAKILYEPPASLAACAPWVPPALVEIVHQALQRDRAQRFRSMRDMLDATRAAAGRTNPVPLPSVRPDAPATMAALPHTLQAQTLAAVAPTGRPRARWPLAVVAAVGVLALVGFVVTRRAPGDVRLPGATPHAAAAAPEPAVVTPVPEPVPAVAPPVPVPVPVPMPVPAVAAPVPAAPDVTEVARNRRGRRPVRGGARPSTTPRRTVLGAEEM